MRGLEQSKAIETGIIFLSKIDEIIPDSIALKRCKQMVQKSEKKQSVLWCARFIKAVQIKKPTEDDRRRHLVSFFGN